MYTIRLHTEYADDSIFEPLDCFIVKEQATREHYQGIVKYTSQQALRVWLKRKLPNLKGNGAYSVKECKEEITDLKRYFCKGTHNELPIVIKNSLFPELCIEDEWFDYWKINKELKQNTQTKKSIVEQILEEFPVIINHNKYDYKTVVESVVSYHIAHNKPINENYVASVANLMLSQKSDLHKDSLIRHICQKNYL